MLRTITQFLRIYSEEAIQVEEKKPVYITTMILFIMVKKIDSKISLMPLRIDSVSYKTNLMKYFTTIKYYNYDCHEAALKCI